ncbi:Peptidyl-dipeptidase dcp [Rubripirellula obstinata]|uniref:Peptidyl-dipeptidase dcp n=1 Tax=Rubripirellula obstinata TaxID=406547 RepID=A0A5B1CDW3_9BACT|nr:M3 family metallopeptidase [Rubripirellula obstinata]KAA1257653.1 Peptidyl-dipeptidase dcp [Rubripirellula obstinata]
MKKKLTFVAVLASLLTFHATPSHSKESPAIADSPLLSPWTGPRGGVPPWTLVRTAEFVDAFDVAIARADADIEAIANQTEPATFENTIESLERAGEDLQRLQSIFFVHSSNLNLGPLPDIEKSVVPKLSEHEDRTYQNSKLFARIEAIATSDAMTDGTFSLAQKRLAKDLHETFVRQGAKLDGSQKIRLSQINTRLARLFTDFSQNVLEDEKGYVTWIDDEAELAGLSDSLIDAMRSAAVERDEKNGKWAITNTRSSMDPFLTYSANRPLREKVWRNYYSRGDNGDKHDNNAIISEILKLRAARAKLLGYETHAHWRMEPTMAKDPSAAMDLMLKVWPKAVARVREEVADMQAIADEEGADLTIEPWDYRYYAEKVRKAKYDLDLAEVKPYLQLDKLTEGMMWCAGELYGMQFEQLSGIPVFHPDVTVWEVTGRDGKFVGLWYLDPYAREGKRSGAWMTDYREQNKLDGEVRPIVSNNSNFVKAGEGEVTLISWDDATTLFHEFGHALHSLCSDVKYRSQSGTNVARDYVEFPSQVNEHWLSTPEVLSKFCLHYETGEPMPKDLIAKIEKAATFNQGFGTTEYLASALIDMKLHLAGDADIDPDKFERETLVELGMPSEIPMRHRTPQFSHIFSSDSYSAGYYSYLWADALTADAAERFEEAGSFFDPEVTKSLYENVMSVGDTIDPADGFRNFRGRDVDTKALLRKRGFPID